MSNETHTSVHVRCTVRGSVSDTFCRSDAVTHVSDFFLL